MVKYTRSKATNFGGNIKISRLHRAIVDNPSLPDTLDGINVNGDVVDIVFTSSLTSGQQTVLDSLISGHDGATPDTAQSRLKVSLSVGSPNSGRKASFGKGQPHLEGLVISKNTNQESGSWSDSSIQARSESGTTFIGFPNTSSGNCLYVGGDDGFVGILVKVTAAITLGSGAIMWEYWNGSTWAVLKTMTSFFDIPLSQNNGKSFYSTNDSTIRFGNTTGWTKKVLNGANRFWARCRITSSITTAPTIQYVALLSDHAAFSSDGIELYYGLARPRQSTNMKGKPSGMGNHSIVISTNLTIPEDGNSFVDNNLGSLLYLIPVHVGTDTSLDGRFKVTWFSTVGGGNVELEIIYAYGSVGTTIGSLTEYTDSTIVAVPATANTLVTTNFIIPIDALVPSDFIAFKLFRDATGGNSDDTNTGNVIIVRSGWAIYKWQSA